jgi:serine/threonine protein kinase/tetratricopeptide (TPR) repeat protein
MVRHDQSAEEIFGAALDLPHDERLTFVERACAGMPGVRAEVERLLAAEQRAGSFLERPAFGGTGSSAGGGPPGEVTLDPSPRSPARSLQEPARGFHEGQVVCGRFTIHHFIARGGMGEVYEAWDAELRERVALKTMRPDLASMPEVLERFKLEVKQSRLISHPNVCRVHELFCHSSDSDRSLGSDPSSGGTERLWFLSMEYLDGTTLSDHLRHHGTPSPARAADLVEQIVRGLIAAHHLGVVHRDLKSSNVMLVSAAPGTLRAVITDFGLALNVLKPRSGLQEPGGQGTPAFMAPEQRLTGEVTFQADQYALGVMICEILTGARPDRKSGTDAVKLPVGPIDSAWRRVIARCLETRPESRFANMEAVLKALPAQGRRWRVVMWPAAAGVAALAVMGAGVYSNLQPVHATSLAVLPLQNDTGDPSLDYLGSGISEALTDDLSQMPGLQVTAESVTRRYHEGADPRAAGHSLRVGSVVDGSLASPNGSLRVPIELIDVKTGRQLWGKTYESSRTEVAELQHEISTDVAYSLKIKLDRDAKARLKRQYSTSPAAYDAYLHGRFHLAQRTPDALNQAVSDFQGALTEDSQYAPAYAGLADCYSLIAYYGIEKPLPLFGKALATSQHALELDSTLGEAYTSRALARTFLNFDWSGAEQDYKRTLELNPNYTTAHNWYALTVLIPQGRQAEARVQLSYTATADPDSLVTAFSLATMSYFGGGYDEAIALVEPRVQSAGDFEPVRKLLAYCYLAKNLNEKAASLLETREASKEILDGRAALLGVAYSRMGQNRNADREVAIVESGIHDGLPRAYEAAELQAARGNASRALDMLELAYARRESNIVFLNVDPMLAPLRSEPRFIRLLGRINLPYDKESYP